MESDPDLELVSDPDLDRDLDLDLVSDPDFDRLLNLVQRINEVQMKRTFFVKKKKKKVLGLQH